MSNIVQNAIHNNYYNDRIKGCLVNYINRLIIISSYIFIVVFIFNSESIAVDNGSKLIKADVKSTPCPSKQFRDFAILLSESVELQKQYTSFPIEKLKVIDSNPEPKPIVNKYNKSQIVFPLMPNSVERKRQKLSFEIDTSKQIVTLQKADTDYQVKYFFVMVHSCWHLIRIEDWSL